MNSWLIFILFFGAIFLYLFILVRNFVVKERASNARLNANITLLNSDIEQLARNQEKKQEDSEAPPPSQSVPTWSYPPEKEEVITTIRAGDEVEAGYDFAIHLHEKAEDYLGDSLFSSLEQRVSSIPGIDKCEHHVKDIFLFSTNNYTADILSELFWREFLHVAEIAHLQSKKG